MIIINNTKFYEQPSSCGTCAFFFNGKTSMCPGDELGHCVMFDERHKRWCSVPDRCKKLFRKAFNYQDGASLVIVANN